MVAEKKKPAAEESGWDPRVMKAIMGGIEGVVGALSGSADQVAAQRESHTQAMAMLKQKFVMMEQAIELQDATLTKYRDALTAVVCSENHAEAVKAAKAALRVKGGG